MRLHPVNLGAEHYTYLDRMPHPLSVNSLVSTKSNWEPRPRLSICGKLEGKQGEYLVVGDLFTFPPRTVSAHGWEICLSKRASVCLGANQSLCWYLKDRRQLKERARAGGGGETQGSNG